MDAAVGFCLVEVSADSAEVSADVGRGEGGGGGAEREGREADSVEREEDGEDSALDNKNGWRRERRSVQRERRAARRESKSAEDGRRSVQRRETKMGAERGGQAVCPEREEDGESLQLGAGGEEGVKISGGGEAVGAEDRAQRCGEVVDAEREEVGENLSKSALAARTESKAAEEVVGAEAVRGVQRWSVGRVQRRVNLCVCVQR
ncbi:hypothetical protein Scep_010100 [Stephania cephalantha]|uniref:Uncharacterized protein n=1 Tax=Stephania cephalantha TaxID=152367 RepID=A0AAP0JV70_9MAGN